MNEHERHRLLLVPRKGGSAVLFGLMAATAPLQCTYARMQGNFIISRNSISSLCTPPVILI